MKHIRVRVDFFPYLIYCGQTKNYSDMNVSIGVLKSTMENISISCQNSFRPLTLEYSICSGSRTRGTIEGTVLPLQGGNQI